MSTHKREIQGTVVRIAGEKTASILVDKKSYPPKISQDCKKI